MFHSKLNFNMNYSTLPLLFVTMSIDKFLVPHSRLTKKSYISINKLKSVMLYIILNYTLTMMMTCMDMLLLHFLELWRSKIKQNIFFSFYKIVHTFLGADTSPFFHDIPCQCRNILPILSCGVYDFIFTVYNGTDS